MSNYIKDKKLTLIYLASEKGIPIKLLPRFIYSDENGRSLVVSVRGGPMSSDSYFYENLEISMPNGEKRTWREKDLYDYLYSLQNDEAVRLCDINEENMSRIRVMAQHWSSVTVQKAMVLAYSDGSPVEKIQEDLNTMGLDFFQVKNGGPELMADFLLSDFVGKDFHKRTLKAGYDSDVDLFMSEEFDISRPDFGYDISPDFEISNLENIYAPKYFEEDDLDTGPYKSSTWLYYYSMNLNALDRLTNLLGIPYRVQRILTDEQNSILKEEAPSVLLDEIDYIARKVFNQPVDDFKEDRRHSYLAVRSAAWNAELYDALGGDGNGSVYLGDGVSISPSGKLTDD